MNIMDYPSERICEALGWLYGGEWTDDGETLYTSTSGDWLEMSEDGEAELHRDCWLRDCSEDLAHALEVTAPWEWNGRYAKLPSGNGEACWFRVGTEEGEDRFHWALYLIDGPNIDEFELDEESAKSAARAAYLRWMRGGLER